MNIIVGHALQSYGLPDPELAVVDDGMAYLIAENRHAQVLRLPFRGEFGGVNADDGQLLFVLLLQLPQLRKDVHAVNSTVSPEVQNDYLPFEVFHADGSLGVEPCQAVGKVRRRPCFQSMAIGSWSSLFPVSVLLPLCTREETYSTHGL